MNITVKGKPYRIRFFHLRMDLMPDEAHFGAPKGLEHSIGQWSRSTRKRFRKAKGVTFCQIVNRETGATMGEGTAFCSAKDNFCKETGRRTALTRALVDVSEVLWDVDERREVWDQYWKRPRPRTGPVETQ